MAVNVKKYGKALESELGKGGNTSAGIRRAGAIATKDSYQRPSALNKVILALLKAKKKLTGSKTVRTKAVESQARKNYGVDLASELAKLRKRGQKK